MHTIELTDEELKLVRVALHAFLDDFGHEQEDLVVRVEALLAKLPPAAAPVRGGGRVLVSEEAPVPAARPDRPV